MIFRRSATRSLMFALAAIGLSSCAQNPVPGEPAQNPGVVDEHAESNVWHRAKLRGVAFRAIGQEPAWLLEITNGEEILLVLDYGETRVSMPYVEPIAYEAERRTEFLLPEFDTVVEVRGESCVDIMSGEPFEATVSVTIEGRLLRGCGRALN